MRKSPIEAVQHRIALDWKSLIAAHEGANVEVLEQRVLKALPDFDTSKGRAGPSYRMMRRLHVREGRPYLVSRVYVDDVVFRKHAGDFRKLPALPTLRRVVGNRLYRAWQTLTIGAADLELAALLKVPLNAPVVQIDRLAVDGDGVILYSGHGIYRGNSICMEMELR